MILFLDFGGTERAPRKIINRQIGSVLPTLLPTLMPNLLPNLLPEVGRDWDFLVKLHERREN